MKILKYFLIGVASLVALVLAVALMTAKDYTAERSVVINAPKSVVMEQIKYFKNFQTWSPWTELDPNQKTTLEGEDGTVGAKWSWSGNDQVGVGNEVITSLSDDRVDLDLNFTSPWESKSKVYFQLSDAEGGISVAWGMAGTMPFPMNAMMLFMPMDEAIGKDFEKGLAKLKEKSEKLAADMPRGFKINTITLSPRTYIGKKKTLKFNEMQGFMASTFSSTMQAVMKSGITPFSAPSSLYYVWDEQNQTTEMAATIPCPENTAIKGLESFTISGKALHIAYTGSYEGSANAHYAMDDYLKLKNIKSKNPVIEEYITDPMTEKDTAKWLTNIYYLIEE